MCNLLNGYVKHIIISFVDDYKNVRNNSQYLNLKDLTKKEYKKIGESFYNSAKKNNMTVQTCFEEEDLTEYGFIKDDCLSSMLAYKLTGKIYEEQTIRKERKCHCVKMVDIGAYNSCKHRCKYCYANFDEKQIDNNVLKHNPKASLLIGELTKNDIIKERYK